MNRRLFGAASAAALLALPAGRAGAQGHAAQPRGAIVVERAWTRATPAGARVAGGFMVLRNTGAEPDRLIGGSFPGAPRVEVHEMATSGGVMTMRPVAGGLVVPPGGTVELKPGGYHMMFMELQQPVRPGGRLRGTLLFERAGRVEVDYEVAPVGAGAPGGHHGPGRH